MSDTTSHPIFHYLTDPGCGYPRRQYGPFGGPELWPSGLMPRVGEKPLLEIPMVGTPKIVWYSRVQIARHDFAWSMVPGQQHRDASARMQVACIEDDPPNQYSLIFYEQNDSNGFNLNEYLTTEMEGYHYDKRRPWYGPVLVDFDSPDVLE
ncbi:hypothetical protein MPER_06646, partial [Moniliophthora perniciosa FA553]